MNEIHEYIKENLTHFRTEMSKHQEEQKRFIQSKWDLATCGYCWQDKYNRNYLTIKKEADFNIVCSTCLFKNKLWK